MEYNTLFEDPMYADEATAREPTMDSPPTSNQSSPYYTSSAPEPSPPRPTTPAHSNSEANTPNSTSTSAPRTDRKTLPCPYNCTDITGAPRMFSGKFNVKQHVTEKHTKTRHFKCRICGMARRGFNRQWCLNRHLRQIHNLIVGPGRGRGRKSRAKKAQPEDGLNVSVDAATEAPPRMEEATGPAVAAGNFEPMQLECYLCKAGFGIREEILMHLHGAHGEPPSPYCSCLNCVAQAVQPEAETRLLLREGGFGLVALPMQEPVVVDGGPVEGMDGIVLLEQMAGEFEGIIVDNLFAPETQVPPAIDSQIPTTLDPDLSDNSDDADDLELTRPEAPTPEAEVNGPNFFDEAYHPDTSKDLDDAIMSGIENINAGFTSEELGGGVGLFTFIHAAAEGSTENGVARL
ncbi:hypothetical protein LTR29_013507 [Friedmanniomyces endolithicus]|nr:hypothetical protein LTR29_013507 [Friedmanniomyces endolithicus]